MKVLMSIKPKYADMIFDGTKKFEYRRRLWVQKNDRKISSVVVYSSSPVKKVIGEFIMNGVLISKTHELWSFSKHSAGITEKEYLEYFRGCLYGTAIKVFYPTLYDTPRPISDYGITRPPQNFMYLED